MARRALGLRARGVWRQAFEINGRPTTEPGLPARSFSQKEKAPKGLFVFLGALSRQVSRFPRTRSRRRRRSPRDPSRRPRPPAWQRPRQCPPRRPEQLQGRPVRQAATSYSPSPAAAAAAGTLAPMSASLREASEMMSFSRSAYSSRASSRSSCSLRMASMTS